MKTFKDIINEVAEPKGGDEKRFKAKHVVAKYNHPIEDGAEENQFKGGTKKDKSKKASYEDGKDEQVYEGYASDAQRKAVHASKDEKKKKTFKEMFSQNEEIELDELSRKTLANYTKKAARDMSYARGEMETNKDTKKGDKAIDRVVKRNRGITKATDRLAKEEVELDEAFKMGSMKLKDGSTVKLSKEEAETVNELFNELNSSNKKRMEEEMMKNKSGFDKVLKFAKEAM